MQVVAADVGNSSIKLRLVTLDDRGKVVPGAKTESCSIDFRSEADQKSNSDQPDRFVELESFATNNVSSDWYVSSVSPPNASELREQATHRALVRSWTTIAREDLPISIGVEQPTSVGIDRLLAALAAHRRFGRTTKPASDVIVIDCGTAMTIDLIDGDACFRGGVIMAGPATNLLALSNMTAALPNLMNEPLQKPDSVLGQSTRQAMLSGAWHSGWGAIRQVVKEISRLTDRPPIVVGTGGGLGPWQSVLPKEWVRVDDLVLDGILAAAESFISELSP